MKNPLIVSEELVGKDGLDQAFRAVVTADDGTQVTVRRDGSLETEGPYPKQDGVTFVVGDEVIVLRIGLSYFVLCKVKRSLTLQSQIIRPSAPGAFALWTPSAGANWNCVKDVVANEDADYVSTSTQTNFDSLTFSTLTPLPAGAVIQSVAATVRARKTAAGGAPQTLDLQAYIGGLYYPFNNLAGLATTLEGNIYGTYWPEGLIQLSDDVTYHSYTLVSTVHPVTGLRWTEAEVNAAQFLYQKMDAVATAIRVTQFYVTVTYAVP